MGCAHACMCTCVLQSAVVQFIHFLSHNLQLSFPPLCRSSAEVNCLIKRDIAVFGKAHHAVEERASRGAAHVC